MLSVVDCCLEEWWLRSGGVGTQAHSARGKSCECGGPSRQQGDPLIRVLSLCSIAFLYFLYVGVLKSNISKEVFASKSLYQVSTTESRQSDLTCFTHKHGHSNSVATTVALSPDTPAFRRPPATAYTAWLVEVQAEILEKYIRDLL